MFPKRTGLLEVSGWSDRTSAPPFTEAEFEIRWGAGIDVPAELLDLGVARGLVEKSGAHFSYKGEQLGHGRERARDSLLQNPKTMEALREAILASGPVRPGRADAEA